MIVLYRSDGVTPLGGLAITNEQAGADSDTITFKAANEGVAIALNLMILQRTVDPTDPTVRLASGAPPQDQMWGRMRIVGYDNTGDPSWSVGNTDWYYVGAYGGGPPVPTLPVDCTVTFEYLSHPPGDAEVASWTRSLVPVYDEYSQPIPAAFGFVERGILHGIGDGRRNGVVNSFIGPADPADDTVQFLGYWLRRGRLYGNISEFTLDQDDADSDTLASGESYYVAISGGDDEAHATKGIKGAVPVRPSPPVGEVLLGYVKVDYQVGGISVIEAGDIDYEGVIYDRYLPVVDSGLILRLSAGQAVGGGTWRYAGGNQFVTLADDETSWVWQLATGLFAGTTTAIRPEQTALLWCEADAAGGVITAIRDRRTYVGQTEVIRLRGDCPPAPGEIANIVVVEEHLVIDIGEAGVFANGGGTRYRISDNGGGAADQTILDVLVNGTSIFTNIAINDNRPWFAWDAAGADLMIGWPLHERCDLYRGDVLSLVSVEYPDADASPPEWAEAMLICRRP